MSQAKAMPVLDPELWRAHGIELLGPQLMVEWAGWAYGEHQERVEI